MGMYDQPSSGVSSWRIVRVVLVVVVGVIRVAARGGCDSDSSYHSSYSSSYPDIDYNALNSYNGLSGLDNLGNSSDLGRAVMPGMSVYAPGGDTATIEGDAKSGQASSSSHDNWSVLWQDGIIDDHDALVKSLTKFAAIESAKNGESAMTPSPLRPIVVGGQEGSQVTLTGSSPTDSVVVTIIPCTGRTVFINVTQTSGDAQVDSDAITSTFECDAPPPPAGPTFAEKKGWDADAESPPGYTNAHGVYVSSWGMSGTLADDPYGTVAASAAFGDFEPSSVKPTKKGNHYTWTGMYNVDGEKRPGAVTAWECSDMRIAITTVSSPSRKYVAEGQSLAATAKCE